MNKYRVYVRVSNIQSINIDMIANNANELKIMVESMYGPGSYMGYSVLYED